VQTENLVTGGSGDQGGARLRGLRLSIPDSRRISGKAVILGVLTDLGGSVAAMTAVGMIVGSAAAAQGVPQAELDLQLQRPGVLAPSLLLGLGFTALGGFVAGRIAGRSETIHGGLVGFACFVLSILLWPFSAPVASWYMVVSLLASVPVGLLGGHLADRARDVPMF
jgi:hypothetical protein